MWQIDHIGLLVPSRSQGLTTRTSVPACHADTDHCRGLKKHLCHTFRYPTKLSSDCDTIFAAQTAQRWTSSRDVRWRSPAPDRRGPNGTEVLGSSNNYREAPTTQLSTCKESHSNVEHCAQHTVGDTELGVGGGPGSHRTRLQGRNPSLSIPDHSFPFLPLEHTPWG